VNFTVLIAPQAEKDLTYIYEYILEREGPLRAGAVLANLKEAVFSLETAPFRGKEPPELEPLGKTDYLQIIAKHFRILYFVRDTVVHVVLVADGRRDFSSLLARRLRDQAE
jgi:toxin ParE1/3/4